MRKNIFDLTGQVAIVTGCSRGLGQQLAKALATFGTNLVITSRNIKSLDDFTNELKDSFKIKVLPLELDVCKQESIQTMVAQATSYFEKIDILVNNAGCNVRKDPLDLTWDEWNTVLDTNLRGSFFTAQAVAKNMLKNQYGRIINIGSLTSVFGYAGLAPYCASRGGIKQLTMSLADSWGKFGITVNCLAPGWFRTKQNEVLYQDPEWVEYLTDRIPLKRPGMPNDLDGAIVFLASAASEYITGQTLLVDGGMSTGSTKAILENK